MIANPIYGGAYAYGKTAVAANYGNLAVSACECSARRAPIGWR